MNVDHEIATLIAELQRFGGRTTFGVLCRDDRCSNLFEALGGTLKAAKKRNLIGYDSELLLQGAHDHVEVYLLGPSTQSSAAAAPPGTAAPAEAASAGAAQPAAPPVEAAAMDPREPEAAAADAAVS